MVQPGAVKAIVGDSESAFLWAAATRPGAAARQAPRCSGTVTVNCRPAARMVASSVCGRRCLPCLHGCAGLARSVDRASGPDRGLDGAAHRQISARLGLSDLLGPAWVRGLRRNSFPHPVGNDGNPARPEWCVWCKTRSGSCFSPALSGASGADFADKPAPAGCVACVETRPALGAAKPPVAASGAPIRVSPPTALPLPASPAQDGKFLGSFGY